MFNTVTYLFLSAKLKREKIPSYRNICPQPENLDLVSAFHVVEWDYNALIVIEKKDLQVASTARSMHKSQSTYPPNRSWSLPCSHRYPLRSCRSTAREERDFDPVSLVPRIILHYFHYPINLSLLEFSHDGSDNECGATCLLQVAAL